MTKMLSTDLALAAAFPAVLSRLRFTFCFCSARRDTKECSVLNELDRFGLAGKCFKMELG